MYLVGIFDKMRMPVALVYRTSMGPSACFRDHRDLV